MTQTRWVFDTGFTRVREMVMEHTEYAVGQVWLRGKGVWERKWRIVEVDRCLSVTFLRVVGLHIDGSTASWISAGLFAEEMKKHGAQRVAAGD